jgi:hypothetical protein
MLLLKMALILTKMSLFFLPLLTESCNLPSLTNTGEIMQTIKIFLASSSELKDHRDEFNLFIYEKTKRLVKQGIFLETVWWEHFLDAVSDTRLQTEYNKALVTCDVALCMFYTKAGKYTQEEFEVAYKQFKATGKPYIYTYFYDGQVNMQSINADDFASLQAFKNRLAELGHFFTLYKSVEDLKYKFGEQLDRLLDKLVENPQNHTTTHTQQPIENNTAKQEPKSGNATSYEEFVKKLLALIAEANYAEVIDELNVIFDGKPSNTYSTVRQNIMHQLNQGYLPNPAQVQALIMFVKSDEVKKRWA